MTMFVLCAVEPGHVDAYHVGAMARRGVRRGRRLRQSSSYWTETYWTEIEAALAYDVACDEHGKSQFKRSAFNKGGLWLFFFIPRGGL